MSDMKLGEIIYVLHKDVIKAAQINSIAYILGEDKPRIEAKIPSAGLIEIHDYLWGGNVTQILHALKIGVVEWRG